MINFLGKRSETKKTVAKASKPKVTMKEDAAKTEVISEKDEKIEIAEIVPKTDFSDSLLEKDVASGQQIKEAVEANASAEKEIYFSEEESVEDEIEVIDLTSASNSPKKVRLLEEAEEKLLDKKVLEDQTEDEIDRARDDELEDVETSEENLLDKKLVSEILQKTVVSGNKNATLNFDISNVSNSVAMESVGSDIIDWWEKRLSGENLPKPEERNIVDVQTDRPESSQDVDEFDEFEVDVEVVGVPRQSSSSSNHSFQDVFVHFAKPDSSQDSAAEKDKVEKNDVEVFEENKSRSDKGNALESDRGVSDEDLEEEQVEDEKLQGLEEEEEQVDFEKLQDLEGEHVEEEKLQDLEEEHVEDEKLQGLEEEEEEQVDVEKLQDLEGEHVEDEKLQGLMNKESADEGSSEEKESDETLQEKTVEDTSKDKSISSSTIEENFLSEKDSDLKVFDVESSAMDVNSNDEKNQQCSVLAPKVFEMSRNRPETTIGNDNCLSDDKVRLSTSKDEVLQQTNPRIACSYDHANDILKQVKI